MATFQLLLGLALASFALSFWLAYLAWPKFRNLERRGVIKSPVPDFIVGNTNGLRTWSLMWATRIPPDRDGLGRLVLGYRLAQMAAVGLMLVAVFVAGSGDGLTSSRADAPANAPSTVVLDISHEPKS